MTDKEEDWVRKRAYALWEEEGNPSGRHDEHWQRARQEYAAFGSGAAKQVTTRKSSPPSSKAPDDTVKAAVKKPASKKASSESAENKKATSKKPEAAPAKTSAKAKKTNADG